MIRSRRHVLGVGLSLTLLLAVPPPVAQAVQSTPLATALDNALKGAGWLPPGANVQMVRARSRDTGLLTARSPSVELKNRRWSGATFTARVTAGRRGNRQTGWVRFTIKVTAPVVVLRRDVDRNRALRPGDVAIASRVLRPHDRTFERVSDLLGRRLKQPLRKGQTLLHRWLAAERLSRGDVVGGILQRGAMTVRFSLELLQQARMGQTVRARVVSTGKVVRARILSKTSAEVMQ